MTSNGLRHGGEQRAHGLHLTPNLYPAGSVQRLLGHASAAMTLNTYAHYVHSMGEATAAAMEAALG